MAGNPVLFNGLKGILIFLKRIPICLFSAVSEILHTPKDITGCARNITYYT
jgi:hypothetical protein